MVALAAAAGVAIENARLYEEAARRERWLRATAEITALLRTPPGPEALQAVADRAERSPAPTSSWIVAGEDADSWRCGSSPASTPTLAAMATCRYEDSLAAQGGAHRGGRRRSMTSLPILAPWNLLRRLGLAESRPGDRGAAARPAAASRACWRWRGPPSTRALPRRSTPLCPRASRSRRRSPSRSPGRERTSSGWRFRGPRPDRPRSARPGHPAAVRGRAQPRRARHGSTTDTSVVRRGSRRPSTTSTPRSRTSGARSSRSAPSTPPPTCRPRSADRRPGGRHPEVPAHPAFDGPVRTLVGGRPRTRPAGRARRGAVERQPPCGRFRGRSLRQRGGPVVVRVSDDGKGIGENARERPRQHA